MKQFWKRNFIIFLVIISVGTLTGCNMGTVLNTQDNEKVAQYVASVLYKRSFAFQGKYPDFEFVAPEETTAEDETPAIDVTDSTETTAPTSEDETAAETTTTGSKFDVTTALNIDPVTISYVSHEFNKEYDLDGMMYITPTNPNNSFLIVHFSLKNESYLATTISTRDQHPVFRLVFKDGTYTTNSDNPYDIKRDLSNLIELDVPATSRVDGVLLFEVTPEQMSDLDSFTITYGDKSIDIR